MQLSDLDCLAVLDALDTRAVLPEGCNVQHFIDEGLIEAVDGTWALTVMGRLYLANLRTMDRQQLKQH